jgi:hypothetical protein
MPSVADLSQHGRATEWHPSSTLSTGTALASDALLHAALVTGWPVLAITGAGLSSLLWSPRLVTARHAALLTSVVCATLLPRVQFVDEQVASAIASVTPVAISPTFLLRATTLPLILLCIFSHSRSRYISIFGTGALAVVGLVSYSILAAVRADLEAAGTMTIGLLAAMEAWNGWRLWQHQEGLATTTPVAFTALAATIAISLWTPPGVLESRRVGVWWPRSPVPEFRTPADGIGWGNVGHFSELPRLLSSAGYQVSRVTDLKTLDTDILVLPPPFRELEAEEVASVRSFVRLGGRLLLIGEHTNLDGVRDRFGAILADTNMSLNFDTTNGVFGDSTATLFGPHVGENPYFTHNRGASIAISGPRPVSLLVGSWWHSDVGDSLAPERGFLSDYRMTRGDRVGNLTLAARVRYGLGHIVLWGDGSPFLNQNLPLNSRYILSLFRDIGSEAPLPWTGPLAAVLLASLFALTRAPTAAGAVALLSLLLPLRVDAAAVLPPNVAVISDREHNAFSRDPFSDRGVTGLGLALSRMGYIPWIGDWTNTSSQPRLILVINPAVLSGYAVKNLLAAAQAGSTVVFSGGGEDLAFRRAIEAVGAAVETTPLGRQVGEQFTTYEAWRLHATRGEPLIANGIPIGAIVSIGTGRVIVLADRGFFFSKNLETETHFDDKNQQFLKWMLASR